MGAVVWGYGRYRSRSGRSRALVPVGGKIVLAITVYWPPCLLGERSYLQQSFAGLRVADPQTFLRNP